jgi:hypothetical protein
MVVPAVLVVPEEVAVALLEQEVLATLHQLVLHKEITVGQEMDLVVVMAKVLVAVAVVPVHLAVEAMELVLLDQEVQELQVPLVDLE